MSTTVKSDSANTHETEMRVKKRDGSLQDVKFDKDRIASRCFYQFFSTRHKNH